MSKVNKQLSNNLRDLHKNKDGWGTDPHDADILNALTTVITAIGSIVSTVIGSKKK